MQVVEGKDQCQALSTLILKISVTWIAACRSRSNFKEDSSTIREKNLQTWYVTFQQASTSSIHVDAEAKLIELTTLKDSMATVKVSK